MSTPMHDASRYLAHAPRLRLVCSKCGSRALVPWQQLDRVLFCCTCQVWYRVDPGGLVELPPPQEERIRVAVRSMSSDWSEHRAVIREKPGVREQLRDGVLKFLLVGRLRWIVLGTATALAVAGMFSGDSAPAPTSAQVAISKSLEERATLWTQALVRRDTAVLTELTEPSEHRALRIWLAHGTDLPPAAPDQAPLEGISLQVDRDSKDPSRAKVHAKLPGTGVAIEENWVENARAWHFQPPRLRYVPPAAPRPVRGSRL